MTANRNLKRKVRARAAKTGESYTTALRHFSPNPTGDTMPSLFESISSPADLRRLSFKQLDELAAEIRAFIVQAVSVTGGHLGSNLGAVELTLAVHRVFNSPDDIVLWDTGHQAYVHKIVTGRRDEFDSLRQGGGLSGYPCRQESAHDWVENSHASTILSYAHGMATALEVRKIDRRIVAVIGDGSMTGGMAFEGLNNLGVTGRRCVVILNDNGRSYAPTASRLGESLARLRSDPRWVRNRARLERLIEALPQGERLHRGLESAEAAIREMWEPVPFFEQLGVRYIGPIDGHDIELLESTLRNASEWDGPIVVHALTQKGRGYAPALADEEKVLHDTPVFDPETGAPRAVSGPSYTGTFSDALVRLGDEDERIVAVTAAMPGSTGLIPFADKFPHRFLDVGIAEQHAVTAAAGMAMIGLRPVCAIYSPFLTRAFDQIVYDVALHHQPVVFAVDRAGVTGPDGASAHGVLDLALLTKVPGMTVFAPSSAQELDVMLETCLSITDGPSAVRYPRTAARVVEPHQVGSGRQARLAVKGSDALEICILSVGKMLAACEEVASSVGATVWDVRCVKPLDPEMLRDAAAHRLVVTVEDGIRTGGVGMQIQDAIAAQSPARECPPVLILGLPSEFLPHGSPDQILTSLGLDAAGILASTESARSCLTSPR
jgi:1-deoxy-D-xylulose-5-phosphate synthase